MEAASAVVNPIPQHLVALARANEVRLARAALKRSIMAGEEHASEVVMECPWQAKSMTVGELLRSQRRWGRTRARKFLIPLALNENRKLKHLTQRQRAAIAEGLAAKQAPAVARV